MLWCAISLRSHSTPRFSPVCTTSRALSRLRRNHGHLSGSRGALSFLKHAYSAPGHHVPPLPRSSWKPTSMTLLIHGRAWTQHPIALMALSCSQFVFVLFSIFVSYSLVGVLHTAMVVVHSIIRLTSLDGKVRWEPSPSLLTTVNGERFVQIPQQARGFAKLVFHNCPDLVPGTSMSLDQSRGYKHVLQLRHEALLADLEAEDQENVPALFQGHQAEPPEAKKRKLSVDEVRRRRPCSVLISSCYHDTICVLLHMASFSMGSCSVPVLMVFHDWYSFLCQFVLGCELTGPNPRFFVWSYHCLTSRSPLMSFAHCYEPMPCASNWMPSRSMLSLLICDMLVSTSSCAEDRCELDWQPMLQVVCGLGSRQCC